MAEKRKKGGRRRHRPDPFMEKLQKQHEEHVTKEAKMKENAAVLRETEGFDAAPFLERKWKIGPYCEGPMELTITVRHLTRDMSLVNVNRYTGEVNCHDLKGGVSVSIKGQSVRVHEPSESHIDVTWMGNNYRIRSESYVETQSYNIPNPHITWEEIGLTFDYHHNTVLDRKQRALEIIRDWNDGKHPELSAKDIEQIEEDLNSVLFT